MCRDRTCSSIYVVLSLVGTIWLFKINNDQHRVAYELLFEESSYRKIYTSTINHDFTVKIDIVVKISVNKINGIGDNMEKDIFFNKKVQIGLRSWFTFKGGYNISTSILDTQVI